MRDWSDERYVRLYTRDTPDWLALSFDAQALLALLLRKVDRAGVLALGRQGKRAAAVAVGHAREWPRLAPALEELLADGVVVVHEDQLVIPNYLAAQEAPASDAKRCRDYRERRRRDALGEGAGAGDTKRVVTDTKRHEATPLAVPNLAVPCLTTTTNASAPPPPDPSARDQQVVVVAEEGLEFWTWAQETRETLNGLPRERAPTNPQRRQEWLAKLRVWFAFAVATIGADGGLRLRAAFCAYLRDPHWQKSRWAFALFRAEGVWSPRVPRAPPPPPAPCAGCGEASDGVIWGLACCGPCSAAWREVARTAPQGEHKALAQRWFAERRCPA